MKNKDEQTAKAIVILLVAVLLTYLLLHLVMFIGVLLVIAATAASVYFGFKLGYHVAMQREVWQSPRIAKHQKLRAQREMERTYFQRQGMKDMTAVLDMHYEDKDRELYKDKNRLDDTLNTIKKVKDVFKK